jgi:hypothetical protein
MFKASGKWHQPTGEPSHPCPCCDFITIHSPGMYEICPICDWEDEGYEPENPAHLDAPPGPNGFTLRVSRRRFAEQFVLGDVPEVAMNYERAERNIPDRRA